MFIPNLDLDFLPISDPGVIKAPDPGSATLLISMFYFFQQVFLKIILFRIGMIIYDQCCGSGIRCLFGPWTRDPGWVKNKYPDPRS
jgi:hypothetical protein